MKIGEIIEFSSGDDHRIGTIVGEIGKKKLEVVAADGDEMRATRDEVTFESGISVSDPSNTSAAQSGARRFEEKVLEFAEEIDLPMLWQFVADMGGEAMAPEDLAELYFSSSEPAARLAIRSTLRDDIVFFKQKRGPSFEPRSDSQVAELKRQKEAEEEKQRERQAFVDGVVAVLEQEGAARREMADEKMADPTFRRLARVVQKYALYDSDHDRADLANELLDAVEDGLGKRLKGSYGLRAFWLMVDMGVWDEHENLDLLRYNISTEMDDEIVEAAQLICDRSWEPESFRRDLTDMRTFSIDSASTRDIDDALSCEQLSSGGWKVGVHVADPSACVPPGSDLDLEARSRGTSIYLPTGNFPMFPRPLSHGKMSLVEGELRPAMSAVFTFNDELELVDSEITPSMVQVDNRMTYDQVDEILEGDDSGPLPDALRKLAEIAQKARKRRMDDGAININLPDLDLKVDLSGAEPSIECAVIEERSPARRLVSELMILNNRVYGEFCRDNPIPSIYRAQAPPEEELYDDAVMSVPEGIAREFALVRKMKPGDVTTEPSPHFGLGLAVYVQASSPIRRYSDLVCQRQIKAFLAEEQLPYGGSDILEVLATVGSTAREASITERESTRYWTLYHLGQLAGEPLDATVVEHKSHDDAKAAVFLHGVALKANCKFHDRVPVGEDCKIEVSKANPRKDVLYLRQARPE